MMMYGGERIVWSGVLLPQAVYNSTATMKKSQFIPFAFPQGLVGIDFSGILLTLNVTAVPGVDTVKLTFEELLPDGTLNGTALANSVANAAVALHRVRVGTSITGTGSTANGQGIMEFMPYDWRVRVVHSGSGNFTYSLGATLYS